MDSLGELATVLGNIGFSSSTAASFMNMAIPDPTATAAPVKLVRARMDMEA